MPEKFSKYAHIHTQTYNVHPAIINTLMQEFQEFEFGEVPLETVYLSKRKEYGGDGFYRCVQNYSLVEPN